MSAFRLLTTLALLVFPSTAFAHIVITAPTPRVDSDSIKEAAAPCGGPRGDTIHQLEPGQMLTIEYDETVAHPGHFELRFSMANDENWMSLDDNIPDQGGQGSYTHTFQVPDVECTDCTFQFIQVMTDRNPPTNYYSCIDVEIGAGGGDTDMGAGDADMGVDAGSPDAGPNTNNSPGNNASSNGNIGPTADMANTNTSGNNTPSPGADAGSADGGVKIDGTGTCAVASDHPGRNNPITFLLILGLALLWGRRRCAPDSGGAPR